jgi:Na+/proline symporter
MNPIYIIVIIVLYFAVLLTISYFTSRKANNNSFFLGDKKSPWYIVAFGMIGASLSGVTFISVPGWVGESNFYYMQVVFGYFIGYAIVATVLMPMYYKLNLTSIYAYLETRFGNFSYKTGAIFFLISRILGASFRLFLVSTVLQISVFKELNVPFFVTVAITILLIWLYTNRGGIKTIIWTDTFQTSFMLIAVGIAIYYISKSFDNSIPEMFATVMQSDYSKTFNFGDVFDKSNFFKQVIGGAFITITMTGLDQDMMQKNLSCRNISEAKKNMFWFSIILIPVNLIFLFLGAMLFLFAAKNNIPIPEQSDELFPLIATSGFLPVSVAVFFILGLIAAAYSSADSALTSLTTSFSVDILNINKLKDEVKKNMIRKKVHIFISILLFVVILIFKEVLNENIISTLLTVAGYTYGPLLGLYAFGMFTKININDKFVPIIAILSPIITFIIDYYSVELLGGYKFGYELILVNGLIMIIGLLIIKK